MKFFFLLFASLCMPSVLYSQIGVGTENPRQAFHIDGAKDNAVTGAPTLAQSLNDVAVTSTGSVGIGTITPNNKLELNSGTANASGLRFTNLSSATPITSGATLGVSSTGDVITVQGSSFTPIYGRVVATAATTAVPTTTPNYNILSVTLPSSGTYQLIYSVRGQLAATGPAPLAAQGFATAFISTDQTAAGIIPDTELLIYNATTTLDGGTGTGTLIVTVSAPTTYYLGVRALNRDATIINNGNGKTSMVYTKIAP
ncbi:hypothetical protein [Chryseobacterium sp. BIGb0232]|uniref:hypothetical protein n=1 Tax=Chryseobacterium sp. BIGb0232 TaxID=2940598 RepID=UPI000F9F7FAB|nr:hypothetical protein [Chryseobacterium sp. BIGb0232]MCS4300933.1 hypothetical protein [Chryseobacterium sp. BIGb0232]ROS20199.1 hypothetical protein EDF65_0904 [Chryseobacterium nakagawai]